MGNSISTSFGFNMGAKMSEFDIYEANGTPTPPVPQPKYMVFNIVCKGDANPDTSMTINTTTANLSESVAIGTSPNVFYRLLFDTPFANSADNIYIEAWFDTTWDDNVSSSIPLFQVDADNLDTIHITAVDPFQSKNGAIGTLQLFVMIFE